MKNSIEQLNEAINYYNISSPEYKFKPNESEKELICDLMKQYGREAAKEQRHNCTEALVFAYSDNCNNPNYIVPESVVFNAKTPEIL